MGVGSEPQASGLLQPPRAGESVGLMATERRCVLVVSTLEHRLLLDG